MMLKELFDEEEVVKEDENILTIKPSEKSKRKDIGEEKLKFLKKSRDMEKDDTNILVVKRRKQ